MLGDFGGGADLDKHGSQRAQGRRKCGKCAVYVPCPCVWEGNPPFLTDLQFHFGMSLCECCLVCDPISVLYVTLVQLANHSSLKPIMPAHQKELCQSVLKSATLILCHVRFPSHHPSSCFNIALSFCFSLLTFNPVRNCGWGKLSYFQLFPLFLVKAAPQPACPTLCSAAR